MNSISGFLLVSVFPSCRRARFPLIYLLYCQFICCVKIEGECFSVLLLQTNRGAVASRCELAFNLIAQGENLQIMSLERGLIYVIRRLTMEEAVSTQLACDRC